MVYATSTSGSLSPAPDAESSFAQTIHCLNGQTFNPSARMIELLGGETWADGCASFPVSGPGPVQNGGVTVESHRRYCKEYSSSVEDLLGVARRWESRIESFLQKKWTEGDILVHVQEQVRISLGVVEEALRRWRFDELAISFNGGKDCLVMLIIFLAGVSRWYRNHHTPSSSSPLSSVSTSSVSPSIYSPNIITPSDTECYRTQCLLVPPTSISCVYVMSTHPFPEVDQFVSNCVHRYHLSMHRYPVPLKTAFSTYLAAHPLVQVIFVGTRRTDPHGANLGFFNPTDSGWPSFVRCQPVIDWHYREIWAFLRYFDIPYCSLYDLGYTSLGGTTDTHPNPMLAIAGSSSPAEDALQTPGVGLAAVKGKFRPAYELMDDEEERLGRH